MQQILFEMDRGESYHSNLLYLRQQIIRASGRDVPSSGAQPSGAHLLEVKITVRTRTYRSIARRSSLR
ncbi:MAG: hypothetical protein JO339_19195 [Alphaproteobacteria bacterium]|nr:hypothetical protein [Alphaproteobacteria bacterium]